MFISFEGGEGSGKSTQARLLHDTLLAHNIPVTLTREPGGTLLAERIRTLVVEEMEAKQEWRVDSEFLLFLAARIEHVHTVILPALQQGDVVICDRFHDSSRVYQGVARALGISFTDQLHRLMLGGMMPDITLLLDIDPVIGLQRAAPRNHAETRFEQKDNDFHQRLRDGFRHLASMEPDRIILIDAAHTQMQVQQAVWNVINDRLL